MFLFSKVAKACFDDKQVSVSIEYSDSYLQKERKSFKEPLYNVIVRSTLLGPKPPGIVSYPGMGLSFDEALSLFNETLVLEFSANPFTVSVVTLPVFWSEGFITEDTTNLPTDSAILSAVSGNLSSQTKLCAQVYPSTYDILNFRDVLLTPNVNSNNSCLSLMGIFDGYGDDLHLIMNTADSLLRELGILLDFIDIARDQADPNKFLLLSSCTSLSIVKGDTSGVSDPCYLFSPMFASRLSLVGARLNKASKLLGFPYVFEMASSFLGDDAFQLLCENGEIPKGVSVTLLCGNNSSYESFSISNDVDERLQSILNQASVATSPYLVVLDEASRFFQNAAVVNTLARYPATYTL